MLSHFAIFSQVARSSSRSARLADRCIASWATVDPNSLSAANPAQCYNLVNGEWQLSNTSATIPDPYNGEPFIKYPDTQSNEIEHFVKSLRSTPKSGLHNPLKNPERYILYGDVSAKVAEELRKPEVADFFARLVQRVSPKSYSQAMAEVTVSQRFFENFSGDQVRFTAKSSGISGDHPGQYCNSYRFPFGPVGLITPFNFPLEIPALQLAGALFMGNRPLLHVDRRVSLVPEQMVRMLQHCGMPSTDMDMIHGDGKVINDLLIQAQPRSTLFTGSHRIANKLSKDLGGRVFLEDAGFDWKILGPDVEQEDYVAWVCDQDAYSSSGQKCSAQSILFMHTNWANAGFVDKIAERASRRKMEDGTVGPVLTWTTDGMLGHVEWLLKIPGAKVLFGGSPLEGHSIPDCYGAIKPTAVFVPLEEILKDENFDLVTTEVFGPVQVVTEYNDAMLPMVLEAVEKMNAHLSAAVVSNNHEFLSKVLGNTVNGTTYAGLRARCTGAPQNHWFGPASDPRAAGIGTPDAIRLVWSCHREIVNDFGPVPQAPDGGDYPST
ncbi:hypothetical protein WJX84_005199 [Apatococcus fuscideae]|uniref:Aldehyde dehydrogenase domain-containing protein n=1 Tax=Apatococcus fuscideae TaxID=2026836 RepID=A0AAW1SZK1_9CHLO